MNKFAMTLVAPVTPFRENGDLDLGMVEALAELLISRGAQGFYLCGGTGEGMLLTAEERMEVLEKWRDVVPDSVPLLVHVGAVCLRESVELARHAARAGAAAVSSVTPSFYAARDMDILVEYFAEIAAAAPELPFYYYHAASSPGLKVKGYDFLVAAEKRIPSLGGMKFTHEDQMDLGRCLRFRGGKYEMLYGKDEMMLGALATGATGFVGGTFNMVSPLVRRVVSSFQAGQLEQAQADYARIVDIVAAFGKAGGLPAVKAAMAGLGVDCGPVRLPLRQVKPHELDQLLAEIRQIWPEYDEVSAHRFAPMEV